VTPRVPPVAASVTMEKSAMQIADAVAVIDIAPAGHTTTSVGATECECTCGKRGSGESKGDCKSNYGLTQHDLPFHRIVLNTYDRALRNRFIDIAAIWACLRQFFCSLEPAKLSRPEGHVCPIRSAHGDGVPETERHTSRRVENMVGPGVGTHANLVNGLRVKTVAKGPFERKRVSQQVSKLERYVCRGALSPILFKGMPR
jgi:hypothetical protein